MPYIKSPSAIAAEEVQRLLNKGYTYSLTEKRSGEPVSHFFSYAQARQAKTRKTRVTRTQFLLIEKVYNNGTNKSPRA